MILERIRSRSDLKQLNIRELEVLSGELRQYIFDVVGKNGGHLSSNLGAVEFTVAMLYVFDEEDRFLFDVGHQSYAYKILTGRREAFTTLRQKDGISGFTDRGENPADGLCAGHSSTSVSAALGVAAARDLAGETYRVISVIGDGAMGGGEVFEGLNNMQSCSGNFIILLNDNEMSIAQNVGALSQHFARIRTRKSYARFKHGFSRCVRAIPLIGKPLHKGFRRMRDGIKNLFAKNILFEHFHVKYFGTIDGHNLKKLISAFEVAKSETKPLMVHLHTVKGKGIADCERHPDVYHGVSAGYAHRESAFSAAAGEALADLAASDPKVVAITAAMRDGTGLGTFAERFPERFFDVGIAEQHAVSFCCGLAQEGYKPFFAVYSTFLQRGFDQVTIDAASNGLPVRFLVDRAGLVGPDGKTHQGIYDLSYLGCIPGMTILSPRDRSELRRMIFWAASCTGPVAIRYPNSCTGEFEAADEEAFRPLKWQYLRQGRSGFVILAEGNRLLRIALSAAEKCDATVISARCIKPLDTETLDAIADCRVVTMEDNALAGGFGSAVCEYYSVRGTGTSVRCLGIPDRTVPHATVAEQYEMCGLTEEHLLRLAGEIPE